MKNFIVTIEETLAKQIKVKAKDKDEALKKVRASYYCEDIVLDADDFECTSFNVKESH